MKTEFLKGLGLDDDAISKIMAENGKDIASEQKKTTKAEEERDTYKANYETAQTTLKEFEGVDVKELQGKITELNTTLVNKDKELADKLAERDFNDSLKAAIQEAGGKNAKAVMACLDMDALKTSKNQKDDISNALKAIQESDSYLFGKDEPFKNPIDATGDKTPPTDEQSKAALWAAMGIKE